MNAHFINIKVPSQRYGDAGPFKKTTLQPLKQTHAKKGRVELLSSNIQKPFEEFHCGTTTGLKLIGLYRGHHFSGAPASIHSIILASSASEKEA